MNKKIPLRLCVGCREMKPKKDMIRVVKTPENEIILDTTGRKNGRGAYICNDVECLKKAVKSSAIDRSLKINVEKSVYEEMERQMSNENET